MRRSLFIIALMSLTGTLVVSAANAVSRDDRDGEAVSSPPVAVQRLATFGGGMRDEAAMVVIGTVLIGLGTAVRRAA